MTSIDAGPTTANDHQTIVKRAKALVTAGTTEMADSVLRVPLKYYSDPDLYQRELDLLMVTPLALTPSCRIANPHDYVVRDVLGTSVLMTRGADGVARAFLNYCRHRGAHAATGCGNTRRFTCPYHAWTYDGSGSLVGMPGKEGFLSDVSMDDLGLVELPSEERHGFLWVTLTAGAEFDLDSHLGPLDAEFASWDFANHEFLTEEPVEAEVNWKSALEAFAENYHFPYVHANSIVGQGTVGNTGFHQAFGRHGRTVFPCPWITDAPDLDEYPSPLDFTVIIYWVYPNLVCAVSPVGVELIDILPGDRATHSLMMHGWMATYPAMGDETTLAGYHDLYQQVHAAVVDEDYAMLPGCSSAGQYGQHGAMVIGRNEPGVQHLIKTFNEALGGALLD